MQKILLTLLKAEDDLGSVVGDRKNRLWRLGGSRLDIRDLAKFIVGEQALHRESKYGGDKYVDGNVEVSFGRSLRRLEDWGLMDVVRQASPGRHGYSYALTDKGRKEAQRVQSQISRFINEFQRFL